ncbi:MAG: hypothetical protein ACF8PN_07370 [Phycisphaerales bacterium]
MEVFVVLLAVIVVAVLIYAGALRVAVTIVEKAEISWGTAVGTVLLIMFANFVASLVLDPFINSRLAENVVAYIVSVCVIALALKIGWISSFVIALIVQILMFLLFLAIAALLAGMAVAGGAGATG